jgi:hypothetical protein
MLQTTILAILEPRNYSLTEQSVAWGITSSLQAKTNRFKLTDGSGEEVASLVGVVPILQVVPITAAGAAGFLFFMKGVFNMPVAAGLYPDLSYSLVDAHAKFVAAASISADGSGLPARVIMMQSAFADLDSANVTALQSFARTLTTQLWEAEPINWTTQYLHLASNGQVLNTEEIAAANLTGAALMLDNGTASLTEGVQLRPIQFGKWRGAGQVNTFINELGSESLCGSNSSTDTFSSSDSSSNSGSSGGDNGS